MTTTKRFRSFAEFYPYYLGEHAVPLCRQLHFAGTTLVVALALGAAFTANPMLLIGLPFAGYGFAWAAHLFVEKNKPATFTYPLWSLMGDFKMWSEMLRGRLWTERLDPVR